jgi:hypothetical protein
MAARWSQPGPREIIRRTADEKGELWTPIKTALMAMLIMDGLLLVPVLLALVIGPYVIPLIILVVGGFGGVAGIGILFPEVRENRGLFYAITVLILLLAGSMGMQGKDAVWSWFEVGAVAAQELIVQIVDPITRWYVLLGAVAAWSSLVLRVGAPKRMATTIVIMLLGVWSMAWYQIEGGWINYWPAVWERARYLPPLLALPILPFGSLLLLRLAIETLAGDVLPVKLLPVDPLQLRSFSQLLAPGLFRKRLDDDGDVPELPAESVSVTLVPGKGTFLYADLPLPKSGGHEAFARYAADLLSGDATLSQDGRKDGTVDGATAYGYTQRQWQGKEKTSDGIPIVGLREAMERLGLFYSQGRLKHLTESGEMFLVWWINEYGDPDWIPADYVALLDRVEKYVPPTLESTAETDDSTDKEAMTE